MNLREFFKNTFIGIFRDKRKLFYVVVLLICSLIAFSILTFKNNFDMYVNETITRNIGFRTLSVSPKQDKEDLGLSELNLLEHVIDVYSFQYSSMSVESSFKNENIEGTIELLYGSPDIQPNIIMGRGFQSDDSNVAICPNIFYPDSSAYELQLDNKYTINGNSLLNNEFEVYYTESIFDTDTNTFEDGKKFSEKFKVIGVYDNTSVVNFNNQCYIMSNDIKKMVSKAGLDNIGENSYPYFDLVVDNVDNIEEVMGKIKDLGFRKVSVKNYFDSDMKKTIEVSSIIVVTILVFLTIIISSSYIKKLVINDSWKIGILKTLGYNQMKVLKKYFGEASLINIIIYFFSFLIFEIIFLFLKFIIFSSIQYIGINIRVSLFPVIVTFIIIVIIPLLTMFYNIYKYSKQNIIDLLRKSDQK